MAIPPTLTSANSMPSRKVFSRRVAPKVQYRLPSQFATIATEVEITFAITGPSYRTSGDSTVMRSTLKIVTSSMKPKPPTTPKRISCVSKAFIGLPG